MMGTPSEKRAMLMSYDLFVIGNARKISKEHGEDYEEIKARIEEKYKPEHFRSKRPLILTEEEVSDVIRESRATI